MLRGPAQFPNEYIHRIHSDMNKILAEKQHITKYLVEGFYDYRHSRF